MKTAFLLFVSLFVVSACFAQTNDSLLHDTAQVVSSKINKKN